MAQNGVAYWPFSDADERHTVALPLRQDGPLTPCGPYHTFTIKLCAVNDAQPGSCSSWRYFRSIRGTVGCIPRTGQNLWFPDLAL